MAKLTSTTIYGSANVTGNTIITGNTFISSGSGLVIGSGNTGVTNIYRTTSGSGYTSIPTITIAPPTTFGGVTATANATLFAAAGTVQSGGSGYTLNDVITIVGGTVQAGFSNATFTATGVSTGVITAITPLNFAAYTILPTNPVSVTGGTGTLATFNLTYGIGGTLVVTNPGSGYVEQPTTTLTGGGGGTGGGAYAVIGNPTANVKSLATSMSFFTPGGEAVRIAGQTSAGVMNRYVLMSGAVGGTNAPSIGTGGGTEIFDIFSNQNSIVLSTGGAARTTPQLYVGHTASAVNYLQITGGTTANYPTIQALGSDSAVGLIFKTKSNPTGPGIQFVDGAGQINFGIRISVASAVNYIQVQANPTGTGPVVNSAGPDANIDLNLVTIGSGNINFRTQSTSNNYVQFRVSDRIGAVNYLQATGNTTSNAVSLSAQGSDTNVSMNLISKGTGNINLIAANTIISGNIIFNSTANGVYTDVLRYAANGLPWVMGSGGGTGTIDQWVRDTANVTIGVDASQNVRLDYSNSAITIIQGTDVTQNANITLLQGAMAAANANVIVLYGIEATQNTNISNKVNLTGSLNQTISGNVTISQDLIISGNLIVTGNVSSQNVQQLAVADPLIVLGIGNYVSDTKDIGFAAHYNDGTNAHAGLIRDSGTKEFYLFKGYTPELDANNNVDITDASFSTANLVANVVKSNVISTTMVVGASATSQGTGILTSRGESKFYVSSYSDPDYGNSRALKIGDAGLAVLGGIKTDNLYIKNPSTGNTSTITTDTLGNLILNPAANGAIQARNSDGTAANGNVRGANSVDLQTIRDNATQVASGFASTILSGQGNIASGYRSFIGGGAYNNNASSDAGIVSGYGNYIGQIDGFVGGGAYNYIWGGSDYATLAGGFGNIIGFSGGPYNFGRSFIGGGVINRTTGIYDTLVGGAYNNTGAYQVPTASGVSTTTYSNNKILVTSASGISVGNRVEGTNITFDSYVLSIDGTTLTLSANTYASGATTLSFHKAVSTLVGGANNTSNGAFSFVGGGGGFPNFGTNPPTYGLGNAAAGDWSAIVGGQGNLITSSGLRGFIGGGLGNRISGSSPSNSVIVGGSFNSLSTQHGFLGGGYANAITNDFAVLNGGFNNGSTGAYGVVGGGIYNTTPGSYSVVSGGYSNQSANDYSVISGGRNNTANGNFSFVGGGGGTSVADGNAASAANSAIVGGASNYIIAGANYGFIGGGLLNKITNTFNHNIIAGGYNNTNGGAAATISGGQNNYINGATYGVIGGGYLNYLAWTGAIVAGGISNQAIQVGSAITGGQYNTANGFFSFVGAGGGTGIYDGNAAAAANSAIVGGASNLIQTNGDYSFIGGGLGNRIEAAKWATISGGKNNFITSGKDYATIAGGVNNQTSGQLCFTGGGTSNLAYGDYAVLNGGFNNGASTFGVVGGGQFNSAPNNFATIGGGYNNQATAAYSSICGGSKNTANGAYSFVGGGGGPSESDRNAAAGANSAIVGGASNYITTSGSYSVIGGGILHNASSQYGFIGGGYNNSTQFLSTVAGGQYNRAIGSYAALCGGFQNGADASSSFVGAGALNFATGVYSAVAGGFRADTREIKCSLVQAADPFAGNGGTCQWANYILGNATSNTTPQVLTVDAGPHSTTSQNVNFIRLPNNSAYYFKGTVIAGVTAGGNTSAWRIEGVIKRGANAASTAIVGSVNTSLIAQDSGASSWSIAVTADTTNGGLQFTATGANSVTIRWVARVETTEVAYI
jgi:hypothetical protein